MKRDVLEKLTASMVIIFTTVFATGIILVMANLIFEWDIFPPFMEKILAFIATSLFVIILSAAVINIMLNISRLAYFAEKIAKRITEK